VVIDGTQPINIHPDVKQKMVAKLHGKMLPKYRKELLKISLILMMINSDQLSNNSVKKFNKLVNKICKANQLMLKLLPMLS
jgi:hypothetical protein